MYKSHVQIVINGYNITFPTKQTLYSLPSQQFIQYSHLMTLFRLFSIHVFILYKTVNNTFYSYIALLKSYIINKLLYYLSNIVGQYYLTIIVPLSYISCIVPQYSLCIIVRYMKFIFVDLITIASISQSYQVILFVLCFHFTITLYIVLLLCILPLSPYISGL